MRFLSLPAALPGLLAAAVLAAPFTVQAQIPRQPDLLKDVCVLKLPGMEKVRADTGLVFKSDEGQRLAFDLYKPPAGAAKGKSAPKAHRSGALPVVIFVNGVGGRETSLREWGIYRSWAQLVAVSGMAAVTHDSRAASAPADLEALIAHLRANAERLGIDGDNIALWACSANLRPGSAYALDPAHTWIKCAVFYYGNVDTTHMRPDLPILVARSGLDAAWINSNLTFFIRRSLAANAAVTVLNLPNMHHAFDLFDDEEISRDAVRQTLAFLQANLRRDMQTWRSARAEETQVLRLHGASDWEAAAVAARAWAAREPRNGQAHNLLADASYQLKRYQDAGESYEKAAMLGWVPALTYYNAACSWSLAGERDRALEDLEKALATGVGVNRESARQDPDFTALREDPRFRS